MWGVGGEGRCGGWVVRVGVGGGGGGEGRCGGWVMRVGVGGGW